MSRFYVLGGGEDKKLYIFKGFYEYTGSLRGNYVLGRQKGPNTIVFNDNQEITFTLPLCKLSGLIYGNRIVEWTKDMEFYDNDGRYL